MRASSRQSREEGRRRLEEERSKMGGSLEEVTVTVTLTATLTVTLTLTVTVTLTVTLTLTLTLTVTLTVTLPLPLTRRARSAPCCVRRLRTRGQPVRRQQGAWPAWLGLG